MSGNEGKRADRPDEARRFDTGSEAGGVRNVPSVAEVWALGRLKQAKKLLERFATEFDDHEPQDTNLLRDYYQWTGEPHYRTEYGWSDGLPEDADEDPADVIERVNC